MSGILERIVIIYNYYEKGKISFLIMKFKNYSKNNYFLYKLYK